VPKRGVGAKTRPDEARTLLTRRLRWRLRLLEVAFACVSPYVGVRRLLEFVVLIGRGDRAKELEILVLRHELSILRRQVGRSRFEAHDRILLAAFSRMLPRRSWSAFSRLPVVAQLPPGAWR